MVKDMGVGSNILKYPTGWEAISGTVTATGISAGADGRKIIKAGAILGPDTSGTETIIKDRCAAKVVATNKAECVLLEDVDVTNGSVTAPLLTKGYIDLTKYASGEAPSATVIGYIRANNPMIVFVG